MYSLEEVLEIAPAAHRPTECTTIGFEGWRHDVSICLLAMVSISIMEHAKTEKSPASENRDFQQLFLDTVLISCKCANIDNWCNTTNGLG